MKNILFAAGLLLLVLPNLVRAQSFDRDDITGYWSTEENKSIVWLYRAQNGKFYGKIVWLKEPLDKETGKPKTNKKSSDDTKKSLPVLGLRILRDLEFDEDEWDGGYVYDPENGKEYKGYVEFTDASKNKLKLRGYIGVSLLGRTTYWNRVSKPSDMYTGETYIP